MLRDEIARLVWESDACHKDPKKTADQILALIEPELEKAKNWDRLFQYPNLKAFIETEFFILEKYEVRNEKSD